MNRVLGKALMLASLTAVMTDGVGTYAPSNRSPKTKSRQYLSLHERKEKMMRHLDQMNKDRRALNNKWTEYEVVDGIIVVASKPKLAISRLEYLLRSHGLQIVQDPDEPTT